MKSYNLDGIPPDTRRSATPVWAVLQDSSLPSFKAKQVSTIEFG